MLDTPPGRSSEALAAVEAADFILVPVWCDLDAFDGVTRTAGLARRLGKPAAGVLNFVTPGARAPVETAAGVLAAIPLEMSPAVVHRYELHRTASLGGLTAYGIRPCKPCRG